ncbi:MAG: DUF3047 domain-containing protein [Burkholderiales bacterium]|nr:DUF3047 domain-containing protein [Burkholderiales bacterium]
MESAALVAPFSAARPGTKPPSGWEPLLFGPLKSPTEYRLVDDAGIVVLHAKANAAASGLVHPVRFDIRSAPYIQFRWKISNLIEDADNRIAAKEDSPVRVTLGFDGNRSKLSLSERTASLIARQATGRDLPYAQLVYIWANTATVGTVIANPHTRRVQMIVAVSGGASVGKWVTVKRNVVEDFRRAFGEEPGLLTDFGVLTDTDNTGASVEAWYGDIRFLSSP